MTDSVTRPEDLVAKYACNEHDDETGACGKKDEALRDINNDWTVGYVAEIRCVFARELEAALRTPSRPIEVALVEPTSPLPWRNDGGTIETMERVWVASVPMNGMINGDYIVAACNSYLAQAQALEAMRSERDAWESAHDGWVEDYDALRATTEAQAHRIAELEGALERYGMCDEDCDPKLTLSCTCGFRAVLSQPEAKGEVDG